MFFVGTLRSLNEAHAVHKFEKRDRLLLVFLHELLCVSQAEVDTQKFVILCQLL